MNTLLDSWLELNQGGRLLDRKALDALAEPPAASAREIDALRDALSDLDAERSGTDRIRSADSGAALGALLDVVLEQCCELQEHWRKGSAVSVTETERLLDGTELRPRRIYQPQGSPALVVFTSPVERIGLQRGRRSVAQVIEYLRKRRLPLGLLTNGREWRLIFADQDNLAWVEWAADRWLEGSAYGAHFQLLRRVLNSSTLATDEKSGSSPLLLAIRKTRQGQAVLSKELGERVRLAVELLLQARGPILDQHWSTLESKQVYGAACRFIMRMVVILFAEARELLPLDTPLYYQGYGLRGLLENLERAGPDRRRGRMSAWPRLLALFRLLHDGSHHPRLLVPAYGGELFESGDPSGDALAQALAAIESPLEPPGDALIYRILELLTRTTERVREGSSFRNVAAPVDFTELTSEYIGILYEGLLDYELHRAEAEPIVFLGLGDQPALPLDRLEAMSDKQLEALVEKAKVKKSATAADEADSGEADEDEVPTDAGEEADEPIIIAAVEALSEDDARTQALQRATAWAERAALAGKLVKAPRGKKGKDDPAWREELANVARSLIADVKLPGELYLVRWGGTRKGAGTFYTRPQLTIPTVRRTLEPLMHVDGRLRPPEELLALKVCDPAMGSGSFLVAALRVLTEAVLTSLHIHGRLTHSQDRVSVDCALIPEADRTPPESQLESIVRRAVVEHCLYGVDLDSLAVELARVSLWVETLDRRLPFTFLDHKLRCGNALVGTWLDRFRDYPLLAWWRQSPDEKWRGVTHEGDVWAKELKTLRASMVEEQSRIIVGETAFAFVGASDEELKTALTRLRELYRRLRAVSSAQPDKRAQIWRTQVAVDPALLRVRQAFDTWCALWLWPLDSLEVAPRPSQLASPSEAALQIVHSVRQQKRFFHWELEFPDVFVDQGSGFDAIVANPPWEIQKPSSKEFFSDLDPLYRSYGKQEALVKQRELFAEDSSVELRWLEHMGELKDRGNFVRNAGEPFGDAEDEDGKPQITLVARDLDATKRRHSKWRASRSRRKGYSDPAHPFRYQGSADLNSYKLFVELGHALLKQGGQLGMITPSGLYTDKGSVELRRLLLEKCVWRWLYGFENRNKIFDIHSSFKFAVVIAGKGKEGDRVREPHPSSSPLLKERGGQEGEGEKGGERGREAQQPTLLPPLLQERGPGGEVPLPPPSSAPEASALVQGRKIPRQILEAARTLRIRQTPAEEILWECLRDRRVAGMKFRRQHPVGPYILDFYCHQSRLVVEIDGGVHDTQRAEDASRSAAIQSLGAQVIRFTNEEVSERLEWVLQAIAEYGEGTGEPHPSGSPLLKERGGQEGERGEQEGERGGQEGERGGQEGERGGQEGERRGQEGKEQALTPSPIPNPLPPLLKERGPGGEVLLAAFMRHDLEDWAEAKGALEYPTDRIAAFSPKSLSVLEICSDKDLNVMIRINERSLLLSEVGRGSERVGFRRDFHMTDDSKLFPSRERWENRLYLVDEFSRWIGPENGVALPFAQGCMLGQFDSSLQWWDGEAWIPGDLQDYRPKYLLDERDRPSEDKKLLYGFRDICRSTDERTAIGALLPAIPSGNTVGLLVGLSQEHIYILLSVFNSFVFDWAARLRISGTHLSWYIGAELPTPKSTWTTAHLCLQSITRRLAMLPKLFAPFWLSDGYSHEYHYRALTPHERLRLRSILDAIVAALYGLSREDFHWILRDCDHPKETLSEKAFCRTLDPKGFWRVDKDQDPELRHSVLSLVAFDALEACIAAAEGDRDQGIEKFSALNDGEGWMLPDTLRLADHGLGHDERAQRAQPVATRLGPRFLDWQLEQTSEESWAECERHARAILGDDEFERRFGKKATESNGSVASRSTDKASPAVPTPTGAPGPRRLERAPQLSLFTTTVAEEAVAVPIALAGQRPETTEVPTTIQEPLTMSLTNIRLLNFRNWDEQYRENGIPLKAITLVLGRNSAGKTSILQPLRMLKQTLESSDDRVHVILQRQGDGVDLGTFGEVVHDHNLDLELGVGLDLSEQQTSVDVRLAYVGERPQISALQYRIGEERVEVIRTPGGWQLSSPRFRLPNWDGDKDVHKPRKDFEPHRALEYSEEALDALGPTLGRLVRKAMNEVRRTFRSFHYLGPLRPPPSRYVTWNQQELSRLGDDGRETMQVLISASSRRETARLLTDVSDWLKRLDLADRVEITRAGSTNVYQLEVIKGEKRANLIDVGYGVSQVLPVLVLLYFAPEGSVILCEDPEAHLHPMAQASLADLFVSVARERKLQILLETHSEHLFRRLQYLMAAEQLRPDDCAIYYVERHEPTSVITPLITDTYGRVKNWPENFFGDSIGETERQMERMFERMVEAKKHGG